MRFELTYSDTSKVAVEVPDSEVRAWLDSRAKTEAIRKADKAEASRGPAVTAKVV